MNFIVNISAIRITFFFGGTAAYLCIWTMPLFLCLDLWGSGISS
jgi:hypothetical protein